MKHILKLGLVIMLVGLPLVVLLIGLNLSRSNRTCLGPLTRSVCFYLFPLVLFVLLCFCEVFGCDVGGLMFCVVVSSPLIFVGGLILAVVFWARSVGRAECRWGLLTVLLEVVYLVAAIVLILRIGM